jgi:hypothetical protein
VKIKEIYQSHLFDRYAGEMHYKKMNDEFMIDSACIVSEDKIIKMGHLYMLSGFTLPGRDSDMAIVQVLAVFWFGGVNILLVDIKTMKRITIVIEEFADNVLCDGKLVDISYLNKILKGG